MQNKKLSGNTILSGEKMKHYINYKCECGKKLRLYFEPIKEKKCDCGKTYRVAKKDAYVFAQEVKK